MRVAFDSRAGRDDRGISRYSRCLLDELLSAHPGAVVETHAPRAKVVDVYHSPWIDGALLRNSVMATHDDVVLDRALEIFATVKREFEAEHGPLPGPGPAPA